MSHRMGRANPDLNVLAVVSLVLGILGFVALPVVGAAGAIVTGEVAKRQILRSGAAGLACAQWGAILGALWFLLALIAVAVFNPVLAHGPTWIIVAAMAVGMVVVLVLRRRRA
jgi:hypothetical protein